MNMYNNNQQPQNGQQYQANPNGGYLKASSYGNDQWYGKLTITPELLIEAQKTGAITIKVNEPKQNQYGIARRVTAKPYTPTQRPDNGYNNAAPVQGQPVAQPVPMQPAPVQQGQPMQTAQPAPQANPFGTPPVNNFNTTGTDEVPF